ncbi:histidine kinase [Actinoplanes sp. NBRC 103695]|uniref:histidine kinase n=1 Tax=Actinoplanes sp. NBRC 103695 TaxID=3032202 RepID=UPI002555AFBB|nr:histidine kinase [Actinoplanes sp. NBRC 103695]
MGDGYTARFPQRLRVLFAVASVLVSASVLVLGPAVLSAGPARVVAGLLVAVQAAAFWWLGDRPAPATLGVLVVSAALQVLFPAFGPGLAFVVLCTYAWMRPAAETWWMLAVAVLAVCGPAVARGRWDLAALWLGAALLAWSWGAWARARGARRQAERRQAVLEERARIARELHDVLSHTVSVMVVQAAAADDVFEINPAQAREGLRRAERAGREALAELRFFLRTVRADDDPHPDHAVDGRGPGNAFDDRGKAVDGRGPKRTSRGRNAGRGRDAGRDAGTSKGRGAGRSRDAGTGRGRDAGGDAGPPNDYGLPGPQPTLSDVERLAGTMRDSGLPVTVRCEGDGFEEVAPGVQLGAYRIIQEALTNILRHARASHAEILIRIRGTEVFVLVSDDGPGGGPVNRHGHGLLGMRERADLLGGTLRAEPAPGGGFEVEARLPAREPS